MTRLNAVLLVLLLGCSSYLVNVRYEARRLFTALDKAQGEQQQLDIDYERLKTEKQSQATPMRVEKAAREKLAMRSATPAITQYVTLSRAGAAPDASDPSRSDAPNAEEMTP